jgi:hypothetical protein
MYTHMYIKLYKLYNTLTRVYSTGVINEFDKTYTFKSKSIYQLLTDSSRSLVIPSRIPFHKKNFHSTVEYSDFFHIFIFVLLVRHFFKSELKFKKKKTSSLRYLHCASLRRVPFFGHAYKGADIHRYDALSFTL